MFRVDQESKAIYLSRGDTGAVTITVSGYTFGPLDRALFTLKDQSGGEKISRIYPMVNNTFTVKFDNADTDYLSDGDYPWDVRYVVEPVYDSEGKIVDGLAVRTPTLPLTLHIYTTVGQI